MNETGCLARLSTADLFIAQTVVPRFGVVWLSSSVTNQKFKRKQSNQIKPNLFLFKQSTPTMGGASNNALIKVSSRLWSLSALG